MDKLQKIKGNKEMKFGLRKPNINKSISARTTGKLERAWKGTINPYYGKKGSGVLKDTSRASYNRVYNKTSYSVYPKGRNRKYSRGNNDGASGCLVVILIIILIIGWFISPLGTLAVVFIGGPILLLISAILGIIYLIFYFIRSIIPKRERKQYIFYKKRKKKIFFF